MDRQSYRNRKAKSNIKVSVMDMTKYYDKDINKPHNPKKKKRDYLNLGDYFSRGITKIWRFFRNIMNSSSYEIIKYTSGNNHVWINHRIKGIIRVELKSLVKI